MDSLFTQPFAWCWFRGQETQPGAIHGKKFISTSISQGRVLKRLRTTLNEPSQGWEGWGNPRLASSRALGQSTVSCQLESECTGRSGQAVGQTKVDSSKMNCWTWTRAQRRFGIRKPRQPAELCHHRGLTSKPWRSFILTHSPNIHPGPLCRI